MKLRIRDGECRERKKQWKEANKVSEKKKVKQGEREIGVIEEVNGEVQKEQGKEAKEGNKKESKERQKRHRGKRKLNTTKKECVGWMRETIWRG